LRDEEIKGQGIKIELLLGPTKKCIKEMKITAGRWLVTESITKAWFLNHSRNASESSEVNQNGTIPPCLEDAELGRYSTIVQTILRGLRCQWGPRYQIISTEASIHKKRHTSSKTNKIEPMVSELTFGQTEGVCYCFNNKTEKFISSNNPWV